MDDFYETITDKKGHNREDAWRLYLGLPQKHNTFDISVHQPKKSNQDKYYFKINNFLEPFRKLHNNNDVHVIYDFIKFVEDIKPERAAKGKNVGATDDEHAIMGTYKLSLGVDDLGYYISYYDRWDLDPMGGKVIGKPFEIYDRIYYNPDTFEIIEPQTELEETKQGREFDILTKITYN